MIFDVAECEQRLGYRFNDKILLRQCFTHVSYANENKSKDNERLEFFGDAILGLVVTEYLFKSDMSGEGKLTQERSKLVSKKPLQKVVEELGLSELILLGNGLNMHASHDEKLYSSLYEAVVAGIYLDGGMEAAKKFIYRTLLQSKCLKKELTPAVKQKSAPEKDSKSAFQEYVQKYKLGAIRYVQLEKTGSDHDPVFTVEVRLDNEPRAVGVGKSKKQAESDAAGKALMKIRRKKSGTRKKK